MAERRARLGVRHRLARTATTVEEGVEGVVALHSSDPSSVYLSAQARVAGLKVADLEAALYQRRSLVRMLGMRRTLFVVPRALAPVIDAGATRALVPGERARTVKLLADQGVAAGRDVAVWLADAEAATVAALQARGEPTAARQLSADVPELGAKLTYGEGKTWAGTGGVSTRVLFLLAAQSRILRAQPLGTWISGQYRWAITEHWLGAPLARPDMPGLDPAEARAELARTWLGAFGPATLADLRWWAGWTAKAASEALAGAGVEPVDIDGAGPGWVRADDLDPPGDPPEAAPRPWVALLPSLDPTTMGWKGRDWYLGPHGPRLFDRNGNAGPTVWADGRVVGGWGQSGGANPEVVVELFEDPGGREARAAVEAEAARLTGWLAGVRVTPRFRTPLERALSA